MPPGIEVGWLFGSAMKLTRLFALKVTASAVKSTPVLLYWFDSHTYGVRPGAPLVAGIEAELVDGELRRVQRITRDVREVVVEAAGGAGLQVRDAREAVLAEVVLNEDVQEFEQLIVRADREGVRAGQIR